MIEVFIPLFYPPFCVPSIHTPFWSMIVARMLGPASKPANARELGKLTGFSTLAKLLGVEDVRAPWVCRT